MYLFILGRQPEIGLAELRAVFCDAKLVLPNVALVKTEYPVNIDRLGGVRKVGRIIWDQPGEVGKFLTDKLEKLPPGKITIGISHYGHTASAVSAKKTAAFLKKNLARSVRFLPNQTAEIADAATLGNKLGSAPNKIELLMVYVGHRVIIAELTGVQDLNSYTLRDRSRPKRDARVGMLPPKLAQIMINLAVGLEISNEIALSQSPQVSRNCSDESPRSMTIDEARQRRSVCDDRLNSCRTQQNDSERLVLLDPFCGTGVVLQEAMLSGMNVYGTDIEPRMISYSQANLEWLRTKFKLEPDTAITLEVADATNYTWEQPIGLVVTETYLGQPYSTDPPSEKLQLNITTCNTIISKFLNNLARQITPKTGVLVAVPCWWLNNKIYHLPLTRQLATFDYEQIFYSDDRKPLIYHREGQIVGRELLVLRKKP